MGPIEREVLAQKAWLRQCEDMAALLDRMASYREDLRLGVRSGNPLLQVRASDLLELAEDRLVELKAARIVEARRAEFEARRSAEAREQAERAAAERAQEELRRREAEASARAAEEATARRQEEERVAAERRAREQRSAEEEARRQAEARAVAEAERHAAARLANARAAEVEARAALLRARAAQIANAPERAPGGETAGERSSMGRAAEVQAMVNSEAPARAEDRVAPSAVDRSRTPVTAPSPPVMARTQPDRPATSQLPPAVVATDRTAAQPAGSPLGRAETTPWAQSQPAAKGIPSRPVPLPQARPNPEAHAPTETGTAGAAIERARPAVPPSRSPPAATAQSASFGPARTPMVVYSKRTPPDRAAAGPPSPGRPVVTSSGAGAYAVPRPAPVAAPRPRMVVHSKPPPLGQIAKTPSTPAPTVSSRTEIQAARSPLEQAVVSPAEDPMEAADREALMRVGRWPPPPPQPEGWFWRPDDQWPKDWTLTGYDLASFRGGLSVTQRVLAGQLGVPTVEVSRAEAKPREKLRPALQVSVKEEMERALAARLARRQAAIARTQAKAAEPAVQAEPVVMATTEPAALEPPTATTAAPPPVFSDASPEPEPLTGADLARWRSAASLSQRQAAAQLGVAHGTVAKAELAADKALGQQLNRALQEALRGHAGEAAGSAPVWGESASALPGGSG